MAHHKDAIKRMKQNVRLRTRNRHYRSLMRNRIKRIERALNEGNFAHAEAQLPEAVSAIHRVAQKGIIHRKQAARRVSRLYKAIERKKAAAAEA